MPRLAPALERHFGYPSFRPGQEELIRAVLGGRDALGILPTGGGKSVLYLLPAALTPGLTLVISPLVSLMADQVNRALEAAIPAGALHSGVPEREREALIERAVAGELRVLLVAPERLATRAFAEVLPRLPVKLLAVDESHCVVQWGFDFRPAYLGLAGLGERLGVPVLAVTATATHAVRAGIEAVLGLRDPVRHVSSFDRENLTWAVVRVRDDDERWRRLATWVRTSPGPALVYAGTRRQVEGIRHGLARLGIDAESYHAGLPAEERTRVQDRFLGGRCRLVVATNAFGMGVDKPDVRRVIHWTAPGSLEAYYQEAGRAGRDGAAARCVVLAGRDDGELHRRFLDSAHPPPRVLRRVAGRLGRGDGQVDEPAVREALGRADLEPGGVLRALVRYGLVPDPDGRSARPGISEPGGRWTGTARRRRAGALDRLHAMTRYVRGRACRRAALLGYFGEPLDRGRCAGCDRCDPGLGNPLRAL